MRSVRAHLTPSRMRRPLASNTRAGIVLTPGVPGPPAGRRSPSARPRRPHQRATMDPERSGGHPAAGPRRSAVALALPSTMPHQAGALPGHGRRAQRALMEQGAWYHEERGERRRSSARSAACAIDARINEPWMHEAMTPISTAGLGLPPGAAGARLAIPGRTECPRTRRTPAMAVRTPPIDDRIGAAYCWRSRDHTAPR